MNFCVKLLSMLLILVMLTTSVVSCMPQSNTKPSVQGGTTTNGSTTGGITVLPPDDDNKEDNNGNGGNVEVIPPVEAPDVQISAPVTPDADNKVPEGGVNMSNESANATVPGGVQLEEGTTELSLTVNGLEQSEAELELSENEVSTSFDVHMAGVAEGNLVPMVITLTEAAAKGLNSTSIKLYHVENGETIEMTRVPNDEEFTAHNQFKYDPATGDVTLYIASFSEIAVVSNTVNAWTGAVDHSWYDANATTLYIANAEQLWSFSQIVGAMAKYENGSFILSEIDEEGNTVGVSDSFEGKTVTLLADINLGDAEGSNNPDIIFYPIGYWNNEGTYEKTGTAISSGFYNFKGTFDGNGHTVSNFYQNTWEMKGDHNWYAPEDQYYRDGMGLFGKIYKGTVKNLTVKNFSSDGEITTTGVIAAYADGATFENIAIFNCNPRVYNIGNGGIVGCVGWYAKEAGLKTTFTNITVDNTNKISALWGSYDVACGGIVGQYYPTSGQTSAGEPQNAGLHFDNCHISAQMDVYNDVCANYQYYAYRYTGMLIGSVRENVTIEGRVYPKMDGITAEDCTVHFGDWNDYYYCELVANTTASYTHDHQMSRLTQVLSVEGTTITYLDGTKGTVPAEGRYNYVVVGSKNAETGKWEHASENATCYHFVDGEAWNHEDAGYHNGENGEKFIDENGDGNPDLKEDKQHIYLEFNNLVTGYGWGVTTKAVGDLAGVTILDKETGDSVVKFESLDKPLTNNRVYKLSDIFAYITNCGFDVVDGALAVGVTKVDATESVSATIVYDRENWANSTISFTGTGTVQITIQDYYFCVPTTITVEITERQPEVKFDVVLNNGDFLHRVGNGNAVALDRLFEAKEGVTVGTISVTVEAVNGNNASGTYSNNAIQFSGTGVVKVTITDNDYCTPTELYLEVIDAKNYPSATNGASLNATANNVVLLDNIGSGFTVSGRYTFYGNGYTLNYTGNGQYLNNGLKQGLITVNENGTLDNLRIVATIYPVAYMYYGSNGYADAVQDGPSTVEGDKTRYHYQLSAVALSGNGTVSNCYIYGGRNNIFVNTGDVTIKNTILECGVVANVQIQSNDSHTITLENVTTIQHQVNPTIGDTSKVMLGAGILVGPDTNDNPTIVLNGNFKQYNWVTSDDANAVSDTKITKAIIEGALKATAYNHTVNGKNASNLGIIYLNTNDAVVTNNTGLPYALGDVAITVSGNTIDGKVCSLQGATSEQIYSDYENADKSTVNGIYAPQFKYDSTLGGQYVAEGGDEHCYREGDTIYVMFPLSDEVTTLDISKLVNIQKYSGQDLNLQCFCTNPMGMMVPAPRGQLDISNAGNYTLTYEVTDTLFYNENGEIVEKTVVYIWDVTVSVSLKDASVPNAEFNFDSTKQIMGYAKKNIFAGGNTQYLPFLAGLKIYDYNYDSETPYLRFDGDTDFSKIASAEITGYTSANHVLIKVTLTDGGVINIDTTARAAAGGSTYTGALQTSGSTLYYVNDGTTSATTTTWVISNYSFIGNNGVTVDSGSVTFTNCENGSVPSSSFGTTINHTVSYDANGGKCGQTVGYTTSISNAVILPTPTRSGYFFTGWYTAAEGGTRVGGAGDAYTPSANITLYAQWKAPFYVNYDANGGTCGTTSEKYTGTALILPTPTNGDKNFDGWFTAAEGGTRVGGAGDSYNPTDAITLYAHWSYNVTVNYNANGGSCGTPSAIVNKGGSVTLPTPSREHYTFNGWYTAATGGTKVGDAGASYTPDANITLYAQWTPNSYIVTYNANGGSVSPSSATVAYGNSVTLPTPTRSNYTFNGWYTAASGGTLIGVAGASYSPEANITLYAQWTKNSSGCFAEGTLITLADGTQKPIEDITFEDELLAWDFNTGSYAVTVPSLIESHELGEYRVINLKFADGTVARIIVDHGFFDVEANKFVYIDETNVDSYVGHNFVKVGPNGTYESVELVGYEVTVENVRYYTIQTAIYNNCVAENMFTLTSPPEMLDNDEWFDYFEIGEGMKYDEEKMQADIERYGLYTYEDFAEYVTYEQFIAFNGPYLKVLVGRGVLTFEQILELIATYVA